MKCRECGHEFSDNTKFCPECGKSNQINDSGSKVKCRECGHEMNSDLKYCPECGEPTQGDYKRRKGRDRGGDDDDDEGGILGGIGDFIGKIFGG